MPPHGKPFATRRHFLSLAGVSLGLPEASPLLKVVNSIDAKSSHLQPKVQASDDRIVYSFASLADLPGATIVLDPSLARTIVDLNVIENIYEGLVEFDPQGAIQPALAREWTISEDGMVWTFVIQDNVLFHDGQELNSEAVAISLRRLAEESDIQSVIAEIRPIDTNIVEIETQQPYGGLLHLLARWRGSIISPSAMDGDLNSSAVGTGAFQLAALEDRTAILTRFSDYWRATDGIAEVEIGLLVGGWDASSLATQFLEDQVDVLNVVSLSDIDLLASLADATPDVQVNQPKSDRLFCWALNMRNSAFHDYRVRQACNYAIDRDAIVQDVLGGYGVPATAPIPPAGEGFDYLQLEPYSYDPDRARSLLADAGLASGIEGTAVVSEGYYWRDDVLGEAMQSMLAEVGIDIELRVLSRELFFDEVWSSPAPNDRAFAQVVYPGTDPGTTLRSSLHSASFPPGGGNVSFFEDELVNSLIERLDHISNVDDRRIAIDELCREVWENSVPWIFSHFEVRPVASSLDIAGLEMLPHGVIRFRSAVRSD